MKIYKANITCLFNRATHDINCRYDTLDSPEIGILENEMTIAMCDVFLMMTIKDRNQWKLIKKNFIL